MTLLVFGSAPEHEPRCGDVDTQHGVESIISSVFIPRAAAPATTRSTAASSAASRTPGAVGSSLDQIASTRITLALAFLAASSAVLTSACEALAYVGTPWTP